MTTPEGPGDRPYGAAEQPAAGQQPYSEPPIPGMPYNTRQPTQPPDAGQYAQYTQQPAPPPQPYYPPALPPGPYQQPYGYQPYVLKVSTNGLAIASMVLGICWVYWIGSILALVFGYVARDQIKRTGQQGDGMAIAGIVLGWVGIAFLLLAILSWSSILL